MITSIQIILLVIGLPISVYFIQRVWNYLKIRFWGTSPVTALCIGHSAFDSVILTEHYPKENYKHVLFAEDNNSLHVAGGPANNASQLLKIWGLNSSFSGIVGNDYQGQAVQSSLEQSGIDTSFFHVLRDISTPYSVILVNKQNGSRTLFNCRSQASPPLVVNWASAKSKLSKLKVILVDGHELKASVSALRTFPNVPSVLDAGSFRQATVELSKLVTYFVCSEDFAKGFTNCESIDSDRDIIDVFNKLEELNPLTVMTLGERGCVYRRSNDNAIVLQPALEVKAVDTTGAGDVFHGAFAFCIAEGYTLEDTIRISSVAGAVSVTVMGARPSIPTYSKVMALIDRIPAVVAIGQY
eukprot:TRINITY_DN174071_c0_g1_i1.p1 TRINITY_DN174071_c0_g1~~TRINITY_DN174071_c0_g1_i1.p1  ORF type:complete len:355 (+),score=44.63 TRINITY_DN174071_c0_g1_i1:101-1165(+)